MHYTHKEMPMALKARKQIRYRGVSSTRWCSYLQRERGKSGVFDYIVSQSASFPPVIHII